MILPYRLGLALAGLKVHRADAECGWTLTSDLSLHVEAGFRRYHPTMRGFSARFHLRPNVKQDLWLVSPTSRPSETTDTGDDRELGLCIASIHLEDGFAEPRDIAIDSPLLAVGFHAIEEGCRRWTSGRAFLPHDLWYGYRNDFFLRIDLAGPPLPRWERSRSFAHR